MMNDWYQKSARMYYSKVADPEKNADAQYLLDCWKSLPSSKAGYTRCPALVVDFETSSLDCEKGEIISAGWVTAENGAVKLATAEHWLIASEMSVGDSATVHKIRDCELENGISDREMLKQLLIAAKGKVLVFHNAQMDLAFLNKLCLKYCGIPLLLPYRDTFRTERENMLKMSEVLPQNSLTLSACRKRHKLPNYPGHNALVDAIATAELFLVQHYRTAA